MNIRKIISEEVILESRLDDAKNFVIQDYKDGLVPLSFREGRRMPNWFEDLVAIDPSGNQKYLMWALRQIKRITRQFHPYNVSEFLVDKLINSILLFHELQNKLTTENIDKVINIKGREFSINWDSMSKGFMKYNYPIDKLKPILNSPKDINSYYDVILLYEILQAIKQIPTKSDIKKEGIKLMNNDYWTVIVPLTHRASCVYGTNTRWCTSSKQDTTQFSRYQSKTSSLFYFIPNVNTLDGSNYIEYDAPEYGVSEYDVSKIALHMNIDGDMVFYDAADDEINSHEIYEVIGLAYGPDVEESFGIGIRICEDFHKDKLDKNL